MRFYIVLCLFLPKDFFCLCINCIKRLHTSCLLYPKQLFASNINNFVYRLMANVQLAQKSQHNEDLDWAAFAKHVEPRLRTADDRTAEEFGAWLQSLWEGTGLCALLRRQAEARPSQPTGNAQAVDELVERPSQPSPHSHSSEQIAQRPSTACMDVGVDKGDLLGAGALASDDMHSPNQGRY